MIGICTDSGSQLPAAAAEAHGVEVVPLVVTVDGVEHHEGVDLDADAFYARFDDGVPDVTTSQPAPGAFVRAYERLAARGCDEIVSIHVAGSMSGTLGAARVAAELVDVPVRTVDSGTASFGVACCVLAAARRVAAGATVDEAVEAATALVPHLATAFVVGVPRLLDRGGRAASVEVSERPLTSVLEMRGGELSVLAEVGDLAGAVDAMVASVRAATVRADGHVEVAVGRSDASSDPLADRLLDAVVSEPGVSRVMEYRIGPSIGAHTGPGTAGLFVWPG